MLDVADSRGAARHGWLYSRHTFSFADYYNPERMGFGLLRVINDDIVLPSAGFATHPHRNMEIISIPLAGSLKHQDSMGNKHVIKAGEIQVMSAGTGITHSEHNNSEHEEVNFLQIWVMPKALNIIPQYDQRRIDEPKINNHFQLIIAPMGTANHIGINQDTFFSLARIDAGQLINYEKYNENNGVYFFIIYGKVSIGSQHLNKRDGIGITDEDGLSIGACEQSEVLCIEVPMK
jgi:quercetin 2,3-dioxygenase